MIRPHTDARRVCVVGAGPVGSLTAILLARQGAQVDLLEARPDQVRRLGGEWLHPAAVDILRQAGVAPEIIEPTFDTGRGFVLFPEDGSPPIKLEYPAGRRGTSFEHATFVHAMREAAVSAPGVTFVPYARVTGATSETLEFVDRDGVAQRASADLIVGADGRASRVRQGICGERQLPWASCMAGIVLRDVALPHEGFGHVILGAPGPILAYRISPQELRLCIDIPGARCKEPAVSEFLAEQYQAWLPEAWREPFRAAIAADEVCWAKNEVESRQVYGQGRVRLVGDALGCLHPITASGMTLGFQDAAALALDDDLERYARRRSAACRVPQALASALYAALARHDDAASTVRQAIYRLWRQGPDERHTTMQFLAAEQSSVWQFQRVFLRVGAMGLQALMRELVVSQQWRHPTSAWQRIQRQVHWLDGRLVPQQLLPQGF